MKLNVERLTAGPQNYLFGFHDLIISNHDNTKYLCLEADVINRPPLPGEKFGVGYVENEHFIRLGDTVAMNYPQGARQQWVADSDLFVVNNRVGNVWGTDLYDASINMLVDHYDSPTHMLTRDGKYSFGLDYSRLHRLGGYGYIGLPDRGEFDSMPMDSGISILDMQTKESRILVSVRQVAEFGVSKLNKDVHHYLTHLCLNPSSTRLAFLHRYFMPDGGLMSRLMTIGVDGSDLRCLGQGFLSHFDWKDDNHIYIFGRIGSSVDSLRNNPIMANPIVKSSVRLAKRMIKSIIGKSKPIVGGMSFLMVEDSPNSTHHSFANGIITSDGHPMTHPIDNDWCVCDTYPNTDGDRDLFLYNFMNNERLNIGVYKRLFETPDMALKSEFFSGVDKKILSSISENDLAFTRSGLHCDLHPRWSRDGRWVVFDSIHEGSRQLYRIDISSILTR